MNGMELTYRRTAVEGASGFGLLISLYDTLAGDLRRAADAQRVFNLQKRGNEINHALLVIGYLEDWITRGDGGILAQQLTAFYKKLRRILLEAQVKQSAEMLEEQMAQVLSIRETWQQLELRSESSGANPSLDYMPGYQAVASTQDYQGFSSWSA